MNLLIDYRFDQFCSLINEFVLQVKEPDYLNLFISGLKDQDVCKTMYPPIDAPSPTDKVTVPDKVNKICDLLREALEQLNDPEYNQPILTSDAKKSPPALEDAMLRIAAIKKAQGPDAAEGALKYLIFLVDVDSLYNVALGIYDFPLVLMVAQHSHKDPREYLPFLSNLKKLEDNYQKFKIDDHLQKYGKALGHLSRCQNKDEFLLYLKKHKLYKEGLELFAVGTDMHNAVLTAFADHQSLVVEHGQSGMLYEMAGDLSRAIEEYTLALQWQEAFTLCRKTKTDTAAFAERLVEGLVEERRFQDAATILVEYLHKPALAVEVLVKGFYFGQAILVARDRDLDMLVDTLIRPALLSHAQQFIADMTEAHGTFVQQTLRLRQVRVEKTKKQETLDAGGHDERLDDIDLMSDTASMATTRITASTNRTSHTGMTGMTNKTGRTSRQRRKLARKRAAGKDAAFEDEFLIKSLKASVERYNMLAGLCLAGNL
ncbi:hypothetical protein HDU91_000274 [Kappamyces sp. JEL0680]|nr:hypothetical protein HDU91_000274 [Kappamyces sp. JEL0680]